MNILERSQEFATNIVDLNKSAVTGHYGIQKKSAVSAYETSRERFVALREVKNLEGFVNVQRDFYSAMQKNVQSVLRDQYSFARENLDSAGQLVKQLVTSAQSATEVTSDDMFETALSAETAVSEETALSGNKEVSAKEVIVEETVKTKKSKSKNA